jgi:hypothetical protein
MSNDIKFKPFFKTTKALNNSKLGFITREREEQNYVTYPLSEQTRCQSGQGSQCIQMDIKLGDCKVFGIFAIKKTQKEDPETGVTYSTITPSKTFIVFVTSKTTWEDIIGQCLIIDISKDKSSYNVNNQKQDFIKRYKQRNANKVFKHSLAGVTFGRSPWFCSKDVTKIDPKEYPFDTIPDNSALFIQQVMYNSGNKVICKTYAKCKCEHRC